jgi:hypothetical protein
MLDLPERGAPFRMTIWPGLVTFVTMAGLDPAIQWPRVCAVVS